MHVQLGHVLAGQARRPRKPQHQTVIERRSVTRIGKLA